MTESLFALTQSEFDIRGYYQKWDTKKIWSMDFLLQKFLTDLDFKLRLVSLIKKDSYF